MGSQLRQEIERTLDGGLIESLKDDNIDFEGPEACKDVPAKKCIDNAEAWKKWLKKQER